MSRVQKKDKKSFVQKIIGMKTWKKITILAVLIVIMAIVIVSLSAAEFANQVVEEMYEPTPEDYDLSLVDVDGYINILLLGVEILISNWVIHLLMIKSLMPVFTAVLK